MNEIIGISNAQKVMNYLIYSFVELLGNKLFLTDITNSNSLDAHVYQGLIIKSLLCIAFIKYKFSSEITENILYW